MVEKMRAALQRIQPRDYYDLWYLSENTGVKMSDLCVEFQEIAIHKQLAPNNFLYRIRTNKDTVKAGWNTALGKQLKELPPFEQVTRELERHLKQFEKVQQQQNKRIR
jgi:predicted nucleotidyltransferase component of viral defense system